MQCYRNSGPVGSKCLKCTRSRKCCKYPVGEEEEEEEEEEEAEEAEQAVEVEATQASVSKGKGKAVDPKTPDQSSDEDSETTPEGPAVKKKPVSGFLGTLSKAVKRKLVDRSPEEVVPPHRSSSSRTHIPEIVQSSRYRLVNVSTEDLVLYDPSSVPIPSLPSSSSGSLTNLSAESDPRDIEIFCLEHELSRSNSDMHMQTARFNQDMNTQTFRHHQDVELFQSLLYQRGRGQVCGQARSQGRELERGCGN